MARAMTMRFSQSDINKMMAKAEASIDATHRGMSLAADQGITKVFTESQRLCPVLTGSLRASGRVWRRDYKYTVKRNIKYGGKKTYYAIYVHEILEHKHAPPTTAKFVEIPFRKYQRKFNTDVKMYVRGQLEAVLR